MESSLKQIVDINRHSYCGILLLNWPKSVSFLLTSKNYLLENKCSYLQRSGNFIVFPEVLGNSLLEYGGL